MLAGLARALEVGVDKGRDVWQIEEVVQVGKSAASGCDKMRVV